MKDNSEPAIHYQKWLDQKIEQIKQLNSTPSLLLHSCCAPCSSYVLAYLSNFFYITLFFYNPNIYPEQEYNLRLNEQKRFVSQFSSHYRISFLEGNYEPVVFYQVIKGWENEPEGGKRCFQCYWLRLEKTAQIAKNNRIDYFATTLTISPHKITQKINEMGRKLQKMYGVQYLFSDFKKRNGFKRSIELSKQYKLYRQSYCGCQFSQKKKQDTQSK